MNRIVNEDLMEMSISLKPMSEPFTVLDAARFLMMSGVDS